MTGAPPTWDILISTLGERRALFERMMGSLLPQLTPYEGRARVIAWHNNGHPSLPEIRHRLIHAAQADYVSFIDDDDLVPPYFADEIMTALAERPDYVGFQVQCYSDARPTAIAHHSLTHKGWRNEEHAYFRDISHLNPMRTDLARLGDFRRAGSGGAEDRLWASQVRRTGCVQTEVTIDRVMYHYLHVTPSKIEGSRWKDPRMIRKNIRRAEIDDPNFRWYGKEIS